jgi:transcriptional regulator of acetoin/glycerol metabolism
VGNVRELGNVIESLVLTCGETEVAVAAVPQQAVSLDDLEQRAIKQALEAARGNLTQAARALGISRSTLYRKVERYGLDASIKP